MGDANPIRTLEDYSKPSHEGYMNTIELPIRNNVVPLRSDTIWLVQNGCSFYELRSEDTNQHLNDILKLVDSLDLDSENRERTCLCLFQISIRGQASNWLERLPAGSITTWEDLTTRFLAQFFPPRRTVKLRNDIMIFQQHHEESLSEARTRFKDCQPMKYVESNPCYDSHYFGFDQIEPLHYSVNQPLNIQNEPNDHNLFISKLIQQKLQNEYAQLFPAIEITFDLSTVRPEDSLRMGDEHLDTISETESDEFIKSSVENLVPSPSESEDLSDKIISMKIDPHHFNVESDLIESLLNHDSLIISSSSKIDSLLDEFAGKLILLKSIPPGIDKTDCDPEEEIRLIEKLLYGNSSPRPPEEFNSENFDAAIKYFSPSHIPFEDSDSFIEEIDLSFTPNDSMPPGIENDDYDSERDILILKEFLSNDSHSLFENESFHFDIPSSSRPPAKPLDDNSKILTVKVVGDIYEHDVPMPRLLPTQPTLASDQEKSPQLLSHRGLKAFQLLSESPMMIYGGNTPILDVPILHFYPP
uniref:Zinc finger, CCHC-type n=1 Tax=Tanacetum cinerariifolium TaxID=118510 RepID=A0A699GUD3_TANCI|nr:zinc finger, CCHC-type [Tanacetum cinerariifolium]